MKRARNNCQNRLQRNEKTKVQTKMKLGEHSQDCKKRNEGREHQEQIQRRQEQNRTREQRTQDMQETDKMTNTNGKKQA